MFGYAQSSIVGDEPLNFIDHYDEFYMNLLFDRSIFRQMCTHMRKLIYLTVTNVIRRINFMVIQVRRGVESFSLNTFVLSPSVQSLVPNITNRKQTVRPPLFHILIREQDCVAVVDSYPLFIKEKRPRDQNTGYLLAVAQQTSDLFPIIQKQKFH